MNLANFNINSYSVSDVVSSSEEEDRTKKSPLIRDNIQESKQLCWRFPQKANVSLTNNMWASDSMMRYIMSVSSLTILTGEQSTELVESDASPQLKQLVYLATTILDSADIRSIVSPNFPARNQFTFALTDTLETAKKEYQRLDVAYSQVRKEMPEHIENLFKWAELKKYAEKIEALRLGTCIDLAIVVKKKTNANFISKRASDSVRYH